MTTRRGPRDPNGCRQIQPQDRPTRAAWRREGGCRRPSRSVPPPTGSPRDTSTLYALTDQGDPHHAEAAPRGCPRDGSSAYTIAGSTVGSPDPGSGQSVQGHRSPEAGEGQIEQEEDGEHRLGEELPNEEVKKDRDEEDLDG